MANATTKAKSPVSGWPMKILAIFLALLMVLGIAWSVIEANGIAQRSAVTLSSENYKVNNAMLSYFYQTEYTSFLNQYGYYLSSFGLDTGKSLKTQVYDKTSGLTWYEYFLKLAIESAEDLMVLCEEANAAGLKIEEKEQAQIDESVQSIKDSAKMYGVSVDEYVSSMYGKGVKLSDIKDCLKLSALATKQYNAMVDSYDWKDADYDEWADEKDHKASVWFIDYMDYQFKATFEKDDDDETKSKARQAAEALANQLAEKKTEDEFFQWIVDYEESIESEDEKKKEEETPETTADGEKVPEYEKEDYTTEKAGYEDTTDFGKWAYAKDRTALETKVIYDEETETYTAYLLLKPIYREEYKTVNVRHILFEMASDATEEVKKETQKKADDVLAEFLAGDKKPESFGALAKEHTADSNGEKGGLYENVLKDTMVAEFNDWIYDEARKAGDTGIVTTSYGIHVMYFEGEGLEAWKVTADNGLTSEQYEADANALEKKYEVKVNLDNAYKMPG